MKRLEGKRIILAVTGSIAAYKAAEVARLFLKEGARVQPVMTASARKFLGPMTLSGITGEPVYDDMFDPSFEGEIHVSLACGADALVVVPATADRLSAFAHGRADDLLGALALCVSCPVFVAPAMHPRMWASPATAANVRTLEGRGVRFVGPVDGEVASGERGIGRMSEPHEVVDAVASALSRGARLAGRHVVVTAGPTVEDLDPVRCLTNRSSGKMGFAIAEAAARQGAKVTLVAGPVERTTPPGVTRIDVRSARDLGSALDAILGEKLDGADAVVMAAAVADYRPVSPAAEKLKKTGDTLVVELVRNPDLLADLGARRSARKPLLVGFALETGDDAALEKYARAKLESKRCDVLVANEASTALEGDGSRIRLFFRDPLRPTIGPIAGAKSALAVRIVDEVALLLPSSGAS